MASNESEKHSGALNRRDLLKVISVAPAVAMTSALAGAAPAAATPVAPQMTPSAASAAPAAAYQPKALDPHQWKTVCVLSDWIIPADDHSGSASQAGVPEFIDDFVNFRGGEMKFRLEGGLAWLDWRCNRDYGHDFVDCTQAQQKETLDRLADPEKARPEDSAGVAFFESLREFVMEGFYTSKMGIQDLQYLGNQMVAHWDGCPENVTSRLGVNYSNWKYWKT
ncbi:MAG: gluconate 2-dehydrogenase subunit 3 family protein [Terriglobia bacterium]